MNRRESLMIPALYRQLQLLPNEDNILHHKGTDLFSSKGNIYGFLPCSCVAIPRSAKL